ncbi:heterokaryon incompatibility protein-domain-containing protein [Aspergillus tetrazonus]
MQVSVVSGQDAIAINLPARYEQRLRLDTIYPFQSEFTQGCLLNCSKKSKIKSATKKQAAAVYKTEPFTFRDMVSSAENGCRGCRFLAALLAGVCSVYAYTELELAGMAFKWLGSSFTLEMTAEDGSKRVIQFFNIRGAQTRIDGIPESNMLTGNTALPLSFDRARHFLQSCEATHDKCGSGRDVPLPKRVIDVTEIISEMGDTGIRLETTEGRVGTYICLSHCWGDASQIHTQTLTTTIDGYHQFIAWSELPKTFRDAIVLTRRLGVQYLWIDSLCIIQNSKLDWEVESVKMGEIYRNSYLTIAASASAQSSGGCFSETIPDSCLLIQDPDWPAVYLGVRDCQGAGTINVRRDKERSFKAHFPLFTRAWVYQERMLSRRILFCNKLEFQVACQGGLSCECGGGSIAPHFKPVPTVMNVAKLKTLSELKPDVGGGGLVGDDFTMLIYRNWVDIVVSYAKLDITVPSDRLPAISATAKTVSRNMKSEYLAGIWRATLMEGLLWYVRGRPSRPRPAWGDRDWRAPSWSWASIDAPEGLGFIEPGKKFSTFFDEKIERAECVLAGENPLGEVTTGFIRLRASLGTAFWRTRCRGCATPVSKTKTQGTQRSDCTLYTVEADGPLNQVWTRCTFAEPALDLMGAKLSFYADAYVDRDRYGFFKCIGKGACSLAPCYLLHVPRERRPEIVGDERIPSDAFLVLTKLQPHENKFERVGLAVIAHGSRANRDQWFKEVWHDIALPEETITLV